MAESDPDERTPPSNAPNGRLDSWKEIAAYLNRDVTTVRRWEKREGMPVHRHQHAALGSVYAFTSEIDAWRSGRTHFDLPDEPLAPTASKAVLVGRSEELGRLHAHLSQVCRGTRRTVFITGELGIGKTALTEAFLQAASEDVWVAAGQCVEQYGAGEPYLPILEGLARLCRDRRFPEAIRVLEECAPSWLVHIPMVSRGRPRQSTGRPGPERMAGELTETIEALAAVKPLVLLLEDLHWSDHSTVELVARLGRRPDRAQLLVIGTYRSAELFETGSPLLRVCRELRAHFQADEIELSTITRDAVAELIGHDRTWNDLQGAAARLRHWSGNPLFLVHLLEHLERTGQMFERDGEWTLEIEKERPVVPDMLRALVEAQLDRIEPETRRLLEFASVVGETFPAALVAHAAQQDISVLELTFEDLCRRSHLVSRREAVRWPDGTYAASYAFVHEFCRQVVYERLPSGTVAEFHRRVGERLELAYGDRVQEISSELATHFDRGRDFERAVRYYGLAAENALARSADREAQVGLSKAAELVAQLPASDQRDRLEYQLRAKLGAALRELTIPIPWTDRSIAHEGFRSLEGSVDSPELVDSLIRLSRFHSLTGDLRAAREIGDRAVRLVQPGNRRRFEALAQQAYLQMLAGEFENCRALALEALAPAELDDVSHPHAERTTSLMILAWSAWYLGRYDELRHTLERIGSTPSPVVPRVYVAPLLEWLGERERSLALVEAARSASSQSDLAPGEAWTIESVHGWLLARRGRVAEGLAMLQRSERTMRRLGIQAWLPQTLLWLAEALQIGERIDDARAVAEDGLHIVRRTGLRCCDAELYRLRGEAIERAASRSGARTAIADRGDAEASFWAGISVARQQDARTLELRSTLSLSRLLFDSGRQDEARQALAPLCHAFADGADTPDLAQARELLDQRDL